MTPGHTSATVVSLDANVGTTLASSVVTKSWIRSGQQL